MKIIELCSSSSGTDGNWFLDKIIIKVTVGIWEFILCIRSLATSCHFLLYHVRQIKGNQNASEWSYSYFFSNLKTHRKSLIRAYGEVLLMELGKNLIKIQKKVVLICICWFA